MIQSHRGRFLPKVGFCIHRHLDEGFWGSISVLDILENEGPAVRRYVLPNDLNI